MTLDRVFWTAFDYIGEAGIGKSVFLEADDPLLKIGPFALMSHGSQFPWRLANDADADINGAVLPQGTYRSVIWGSNETFLYSYDPAVFGKTELISKWGFTAVSKNWNWDSPEGTHAQAAVFSNGDEVELFQNGSPAGRLKAGERPAADLPKSFLFDLPYVPGELTAVSYKDGAELSRDTLKTAGPVKQIRLIPEKTEMSADGHDVIYVHVELIDEEGLTVPDSDRKLHASVDGSGTLSAFGSANPITDENYTSGDFTSFRGTAEAVIRSSYTAGSCTLTVSGEGLETVSVTLHTV